MAKNDNQKQKLLTILKLLEKKTDENHKLSTQQIIEELAKENIIAERKSIYSDINTLTDMGYDIILDKSRSGGYYLASRSIEKHELVVLVDAVSSSKFITLKKSRELIKKLEGLLSVYEAKELDREVFVNNRIKQDNESIFYVVDDIHNALSHNQVISFQYCEWNVNKELVPRHNGKLYNVSPLSLAWNDEQYYLIGIDNDINEIRHYRVDKIKNISVTDFKANAFEEGKIFDVASYSNKFFGMFGGTQTVVELEYDENLVGVIIDRFGKDINIIKKDNKYHSRVDVSISSQFYGWIAGLNGQIKIFGPENVKEDYRQFLTKAFELYS